MTADGFVTHISAARTRLSECLQETLKVLREKNPYQTSHSQLHTAEENVHQKSDKSETKRQAVVGNPL